MKTLIHEIAVIDKLGKKHQVSFNSGLNIVTGRSSTGKSALIEIFDYCFGSSENNIPQGIITTHAAIYYVALAVNDQNMILARDPNIPTKAFFRRIETFVTSDIDLGYFNNIYFRSLKDFKHHLNEFFLDIDDVDESLIVRENRINHKKASTPSIRSFPSFMLQHQNLIANKHALFYRFDEKEKRDQVIEHTKIFLGIVKQEFFILSQEKERIVLEIKRLQREKESYLLAADSYKEKIGPILLDIYALMGGEDVYLSPEVVLRHPQDAKEKLDRIIISERINYSSDASIHRYNELTHKRNELNLELRKLHRKLDSINNNLKEEKLFVDNVHQFISPKNVHISTSVCPFCHTEKESLRDSAERLQQAIIRISGNLAQTPIIKAKLETTSAQIKHNIKDIDKELADLNSQIFESENVDRNLARQKSLYESILMKKAKLFALLDTINMNDDTEVDRKINNERDKLININKAISEYDIKNELEKASNKVNKYMDDIGRHFMFEESYSPIKLHFSFETFDLYHLTSNDERIYLRSMGSGANWLYCHITLFLALHQYFTELGNKCAIPSILFLDQPTQVYFPNFKRDISQSFDEQKIQEKSLRTSDEKSVDEDIIAVENLFSQLSIYCDQLEKKYGFCPQIIVTDHADNLVLSNGVDFNSLVNENRWRTRGFIKNVN